MKEEKKNLVPNWLKELQQRSWEPEILLSGIVLYGMFKVPEILDEFLNFFKLNIFGDSQDIDNLVALFKMGIYWLIGGLILHLICRGIWIGMVGLSYTFPKGIREEKLSFKGKFQDKISKTPTYEEIVIRLEKISSSLFSVSFMLFMSLIGGYLFFLVLIIIPFTIIYIYFDIGFNDVFFEYFQVYVLIIVSVGIIGLLDFVSLGYFRRFKWFTKIYWPLHKIISLLTLSRFYRPIYYGFVTNFNKWAFFLLLLVFTFVSILGAGGIANNSYPSESFSRLSLWESAMGYTVFEGYYDDQNQDNPSQKAQIQSDVINGDVLKLFVVANVLYEESMLKYTSLDSLKEVYPDTITSALNLMVLDIYIQVVIDNDTIDVERWYQHYKVSTKQRGYLAYIPIGSLSEGLHHLKVLGSTKRFRTLAEIPFYRDVSLYNRIPIKENTSNSDNENFQAKPFGVKNER
jgi:hypothetical protein